MIIYIPTITHSWNDQEKNHTHPKKQTTGSPTAHFFGSLQMRGLCTLLLPLQRWAVGDSLSDQGGSWGDGWQHGGKGCGLVSQHKKNTTWSGVGWRSLVPLSEDLPAECWEIEVFWGGFQSQVNNDIWTGTLKFRLFSAGWSVVRWLRCQDIKGQNPRSFLIGKDDYILESEPEVFLKHVKHQFSRPKNLFETEATKNNGYYRCYGCKCLVCIYIYYIYILFWSSKTTTKMSSFNQDPLRVQPFLSKVFEVPMANLKIILCEQWPKKPGCLRVFLGMKSYPAMWGLNGKVRGFCFFHGSCDHFSIGIYGGQLPLAATLPAAPNIEPMFGGTLLDSHELFRVFGFFGVFAVPFFLLQRVENLWGVLGTGFWRNVKVIPSIINYRSSGW